MNYNVQTRELLKKFESKSLMLFPYRQVRNVLSI